MENALALGAFLERHEFISAEVIRRSESDFLYYDPPISFNPEYFEQYRSNPAGFPSSLYEKQGIRLSFDLERALYLQFIEISTKISSTTFDNYLLEGEIIENLKTVTSPIELQKISKDIVILNLGIDIPNAAVKEMILNVATPFDRIWLYNDDNNHFNMTNTQDFLNNGFIGDHRSRLRLEEIDDIYQAIEEQSESEFEYYRNNIFITFFVLFKRFSNEIIRGKLKGNCTVFFWYTDELDEAEIGELLTQNTHFCKLRAPTNSVVKNRNTCVHEAIETIANENQDTSVLLSVKDSRLVVGTADYENGRYTGFKYSYYNLDDFSSNCMSNDLSLINIGLQYEDNHILYVSHYNQNRVQYKVGDNIMTYEQILPFPTRRINVAKQALSYSTSKIQFIVDGSRNVGFIEKTTGQYVYENMSGEYTVEVLMGDVGSLFRRRASPKYAEADEFMRNMAEYAENIWKINPLPIKDELGILAELAANASQNRSPVEPDVPFEITDFTEQIRGIDRDDDLELAYYIPFLNDSFEILRNYGNVDYFESEIDLSMRKLLSGDYEGAQKILNRFTKFTYLDLDKQSYFRNETVCQQMDKMDYFIRRYDAHSDYPDKLLLDDHLRKTYYESDYVGKLPRISTLEPIFSPLLADVLMQSEAELMYAFRQLVLLWHMQPNFQRNNIVINRNLLTTSDYYEGILLTNDLENPLYMPEQILRFYETINLNVMTVFDPRYFAPEMVRRATKNAYTLSDNAEYRIIELDDGTMHHVVITSISSFGRFLTGKEVAEVFLFSECLATDIETLGINASFMIFDSHAELVRTPVFEGDQASDFQKMYETMHMHDILIEDLILIGFLEIQRANFTATIQKGTVMVNKSFDFSRSNYYISHVIANLSEPDLLCFGRRFTNMYVVTAEYFVCKLLNSQEFMLGLDHFVPNIETIDWYEQEDFANINYGYYNRIHELFAREDISLLHYYNFSQRSANTRNIIHSQYFEDTTKHIAYFNAENLLLILFMAVSALAFAFALVPRTSTPAFMQMERQRVQLNCPCSKKYENEPTMQIEKQPVAPIQIPPVNTAIDLSAEAHRLVFAQDYQTVVKYGMISERVTSGEETHFSVLTAHERDRPNGVIYETSFVIQRNIFANAVYSDYYDNELQITNELFVIQYDFGPTLEMEYKNVWKVQRTEDFYDRQLRAPYAEQQFIEFGGVLQFTDLVLLLCK